MLGERLEGMSCPSTVGCTPVTLAACCCGFILFHHVRAIELHPLLTTADIQIPIHNHQLPIMQNSNATCFSKFIVGLFRCVER